jgi:hypothetical protein
MTTCADCYGVNTIDPCAEVGCLSTNYGKCITYSGTNLFCSLGPIKTFTSSGTAVAITPAVTVVVAATGGTGSGATFSVTRGPSSTSYTVSLVNPGSGYAVGDSLTIAGASLGGATTANNLTIAVTTLSALIDTTYTMDAAIKNLHDRLCSLTPSGLLYSGFNYGCLRSGGNLESTGSAITTAQGFAESASAALCALNTRVKAVETPTFTVPACVTGLTSGTSTLGAILTEYGSKLCAIVSGSGGITITGVTVPGSCTMSAQPSSTASLGTWFDWVVDNMCSITTGLSASITSTNSNVSTITTFLGSTVRFNNSANCLTALGGTGSDSAHATIGYLTTKVCAVDATVTAIPAYIKTDTIALNWVGCFGSAPYSYTNTGTTIQTQLQRIVAVLNAEKTSYSGDFVVTTAGCGSKIVSLAAGTAFSCASLSGCSIDALGDVVITTPSNPHVLYYNGTNWVNKNINSLVTLSSADSTVTITPVTTAGNVNFDLSVTAATTTRANLTAIAVAGANNTFPAAYPTSPGSGYVQVTKQSNIVTLAGSIELVTTSGLTLAFGTPVPVATVPAGFRPVAGTISFYAKVFKKATAPYTDPDGSFDARITIDTGGTVTMIPYPAYPAASLVLSVAGTKVEILVGSYSYSILP